MLWKYFWKISIQFLLKNPNMQDSHRFTLVKRNRLSGFMVDAPVAKVGLFLFILKGVYPHG